MPTRDNKSNQRPINFLDNSFVANGSANSDIIDTADYDMGIFLEVYLLDQLGTTVTAGAVAVAVFESDDAAMSGETELDAVQIIGSVNAIAFDDDNSPSGDSAAPSVLPSFGIISTKRYVRVTATMSAIAGTGTPGLRVVGQAVERGEYNPQ